MNSKNQRYGIGIIPRDPITRILLLGYRGPDERTALFVVHSVAYSIYLSFLVSNLLFFFSEEFIRLNLKLTIAVWIVCTARSFVRYAMDKSYSLEALETKRFFVEVFLTPLFIVLIYVALYLAAFKDMPHTPLNIYLVYVVLQSFMSGICAYIFSNTIINLFKAIIRLRLTRPL